MDTNGNEEIRKVLGDSVNLGDSIDIKNSRMLFSSTTGVTSVLDALPYYVMILNEQRQVIHGNTNLLATLGIQLSSIIGNRPGDILHCVHVKEGPQGCGTSRNCNFCGIFKAFYECQKTKKRALCETRVLRELEGKEVSQEMLVVASPITLSEETITVISMADISTTKRKDYLERIFYHDILNTTSIILFYADLLSRELHADHKEMATIIMTSTLHLVEQIKAQRDLSQAEAGELVVNVHSFTSQDILVEVENSLAGMAAEKEVTLVMDIKSHDVEVMTDRLLLKRVLTNLLKNAIEASHASSMVTLSCWEDEFINFSIQNESVMPEAVRLQVFERTFSTKGKNRGLGTYSIKLLTERYLKGSVNFLSDEGFGTVFTISVPKVLTE